MRITVDEIHESCGIGQSVTLYVLRKAGGDGYATPSKEQMKWLAARINDGTIRLPKDKRKSPARNGNLSGREMDDAHEAECRKRRRYMKRFEASLRKVYAERKNAMKGKNQ